MSWSREREATEEQGRWTSWYREGQSRQDGSQNPAAPHLQCGGLHVDEALQRGFTFSLLWASTWPVAIPWVCPWGQVSGKMAPTSIHPLSLLTGGKSILQMAEWAGTVPLSS